MRMERKHKVAAGLAMLLVSTGAALGDIAAGMQAFRNKDYQTAFREWKAAAEAGQAEAQFDLGLLYAEGLGTRRDLAEAAKWYRKAADQANAQAEFALGQMYSRGWGAPRDTADILRWMREPTVDDATRPCSMPWPQLAARLVQRPHTSSCRLPGTRPRFSPAV